jgi:diguanylate cyclase (GGDEF)-like protein/PAS domain S-box-containing protein
MLAGTSLLGAAAFWIGLWLFDLTQGLPPAGWFLLAFTVIAVLQTVSRPLKGPPEPVRAAPDEPGPDETPPQPEGRESPGNTAEPAQAPAPTVLVDTRTGGEQDSQHARLRRIFDSSNDAIFVLAVPGCRIIDCNPRAQALLGRDRETVLDQPIDDHLAEESEDMAEFAGQVLETGSGFSDRFHLLSSDGQRIPTEISASVLDLEEGATLLFMVRDISERKLAESRIQHLAYHDTLTDLPNRSLFKDRMKVALARARRSGDLGALLFLDLDNFKRINDTLGHSVGDRLLQIVAQRLTGTLRAEDTVARLGGDEFVILIERLGRDTPVIQERLQEIAAKIREVLARPCRLEEHELYVTSSIGIVTFPTDGADVDELLRHADVAMYEAKGSGRDAAKIFSEDMHRGAMARLEAEEGLRHALQDGRLALHYQPIMTVRDGRMIGAEAFLRWQQDDGSWLTPTQFLPQIEDPALLVRVSDWVLNRALATIAELQRTSGLEPPFYIAINLSNQQFRQADFPARVRELLEQTGADPNLVLFDITEKALDSEPLRAGERVRELRDLGIRFAIDDFGTGFSSLVKLKGLPVDALKIDRGFIHNVSGNASDEAIVDAVLSLARHFGLDAIAEGVESREQAVFLRDRGCEFYQGMLARPPLTEQAFSQEIVERAAIAAMD